MKKILTLLLIFVFLIHLAGCGKTDISNASVDEEVLSQSIDLLSKANSYEFTRVESTTFHGDKQIISHMISEQKTILDPYVNWSRTHSTSSQLDGSQFKSLTEIYQKVDDDQFDMYIRYSSDHGQNTEEVLSDWENIFSGKKEQGDLIIDSVRSHFDAQRYLLSANIDTFEIVEDDETKDNNVIKYDGYLEQDSILEAYQKYIRDIYAKGGLLPESENPTLDDLKSEITSGDYLELQTGIPKLALSENPIPVSLWINKNTFQLMRVAIDETSVMQSLMEIQKESAGLELPIVSEATVTYEIKGINNLKEIPIPE